MTFGETVRQLRILAGMKQEDLAVQWGPSVSTISRIENNQAKVTIKQLPRLASLLKTPLINLLNAIDPDGVEILPSQNPGLSVAEREVYERFLRQCEQENQALKRELLEKKLEIEQLRIENKEFRQGFSATRQA
ncbi:helix-turn-helix domain-containing protein [Larkinella sp. GY13]|uniref:helix-turn-helix domain-containing protein n=1 Tax=Larkinella sp. GY13 TaxID=3453720 RepID=UPI003EEEBA44